MPDAASRELVAIDGGLAQPKAETIIAEETSLFAERLRSRAENPQLSGDCQARLLAVASTLALIALQVLTPIPG